MRVGKKVLRAYDKRQQEYNNLINNQKTSKIDPTKAFRRPGSRNPKRVRG